MRVSLPAPPKRFARGSAPLASLSVIVSLPPWPKTWISAVFATGGVPPVTATAPPLTRMVPAALRLTVDVVVEVVAEDGQVCQRREERGGDGGHLAGFERLEALKPNRVGGSRLRPGRRAPRSMAWNERASIVTGLLVEEWGMREFGLGRTCGGDGFARPGRNRRMNRGRDGGYSACGHHRRRISRKRQPRTPESHPRPVPRHRPK